MRLLGSTFGWTQIARSDVNKAVDVLRGGERGVRDEIGFLALHQGFANRFFPGTSVLQTRLRYALFVPWQINDQLSSNPASRELAETGLKRAEQRLVHRLLRGAAKEPNQAQGIIGSRSSNHDPDQPPSTIYWTALRKWQILQPRSGRMPSRDAILSRPLASEANVTDEADESLLENAFYALPAPPKEWIPLKQARGMEAPGLTFRLEVKERKYLLERLQDLRRDQSIDSARSLSLFARLAASKPNRDWSWRDVNFDEARIRQLACDGDDDALEIASQASALARIGRAAYSALVQHVAEEKDGRSRSNSEYKNLLLIVAEEGSRARNLKLPNVRAAIGSLDPKFAQALDATLLWLKTDRKQIGDLLAPYKASEIDRKDARARLGTFQNSSVLRKSWLDDVERKAVGLNYRWHRVAQLLDDLHDFRD